ncbi:efflux RND transporter permease subunit [uncultured Mailhella sp.]|uniref:efflux RND transporter permease subunit n=1 Tax=uncultured Mailhella sp. TaxID=1981031 RepID=UPI0025E47798|nr:efflux RND transporter permease subunit [uncultured Mailhella sp.]
MNISTTFIKRPVATTLLMMGILVFGWMSYLRLPLSENPNIDYPVIIVSATLSGASPETMATSVAKPLEKQLSTIASIKNMTSTNKLGRTMVRVEFELDRDIDGAALDVQSAISIAYSRMPDTMTQMPRFMKLDPDSLPVIQIALTSNTITRQQLTDYAENYVSQRLSMVAGVSKSDVRGAKRYAVRVNLRPDLMQARDVSAEEIRNGIDAANVTLPTGKLEGSDRIRNIKDNGSLIKAEDFAKIVVAWRNGAPVRLSDVADVEEGVEETNQASFISGNPGVIVQVTKQPGGNTVQIVSDILDLLADIENTLPPSIDMAVVEDTSIPIKESVTEVELTLLLTILLVVLVIYIFLRDGMATIIPSLALPLSVVATFPLMFAAGFSLDNMSLMALILVVGFVVDDAIVMLENIIRHREMGKSPFNAAMDGAGEIGFTILSMTISLGAVFIPLLFLPGTAGRMFFEFAAVIIIAISISFFISISLTPMMSALFLTDQSVHLKHSGIKAAMERGFVALLSLYSRSLHFVMRHRVITFVGSLLLIAATWWLSTLVPTGYFPAIDGGRIRLYARAEESISFEALTKAVEELHPIISADPAVRSFTTTIGGGTRADTNTANIMIRLKPISERDNINVVIDRLRKALDNNPTLMVSLRNANMQGAGGSTTGIYTYTLVGSNTAELYAAARDVEEALHHVKSVRDVGSDLQLMNPSIRLIVDRDKATMLGITLSQIENSLYSAFGTREISTIYTDVSDYTVKMEVARDLQDSASILESIYLRSGKGKLVPLETLVTRQFEAGPLSVNHRGQFPAVSISFNVASGYAMGEAMADVENAARDILPASVSGSLTGTAQDFQDSVHDMILIIVVALLLIYIVLGILYESFIHPITILSGLPSAAFGALFSLWLFNSELNMTAFVGIIMLIGIVKKNAIMVLDFALAAERSGSLDTEDAIIQGCLIRFRPILMTTLAAVMGALPLAFGIGATGAEARQPIGICVSGGLIFSQLVTLYITPVYYVYLDNFGKWVSRNMRRIFRKSLAEPSQADASSGQAQ